MVLCNSYKALNVMPSSRVIPGTIDLDRINGGIIPQENEGTGTEFLWGFLMGLLLGVFMLLMVCISFY